MNTIFIITGQTATGKTKYALDLAEKVNGELINFDSRQIYQFLDIVTGKDVDGTFTSVRKKGNKDVGYYSVQSETGPVKLWLYDIIDPKISFSSFDFEELALESIQDILSRGKTPILVGGTYLYMYYLLYGERTNTEPDWDLRKMHETTSVVELQNLVQKKDPQLLERMNDSDRNNPHRLIRILEGKQPVEVMNHSLVLDKKLGLTAENLEIFVTGFEHLSTDKIREQIKKRVIKRLENGAVKETEELIKRGYTIDDPGLKGIGYKQLIAYVNKQISYEKLIEDWVTKEYQYSKRQYTFMRRDPNIKWHIV